MRNGCPRATVAAVIVAVAGLHGNALPAQSDRLTRTFERALAGLGDPATATDAVRTLVNLGPAAVEPLRLTLRSPRRAELAPGVLAHVVYVLGRFGRTALPALPELRAICSADQDPGLLQQVLWAVSMLAPFCDAEQCGGLEWSTDQLPSRSRWTFAGQVVMHSVRLHADVDAQPLLAGLEQSDPCCVAACRWLAARPEAHREHRAEFRAALDRRLAGLLRRDAIRWLGPAPGSQGSQVVADLAEARVSQTDGQLDASSARGLLDHWHADARRKAIAWLHDGGAALPWRERADLVGRLWDSDPGLVVAAADAFAAWGKAGLVAVPALRGIARTTPGPVGAACTRAADAVIAAWELPAADRAWLGAVDSAFRGAAVPAPGVAAGPTARTLAAELLFLAQWHDAATLAPVLDAVEVAGPVEDGAVQSVLGWLDRDDATVVATACAWLARHGSDVRRVLGAMGDVESELGLVVQFARGAGVAIELTAQVLVTGAAPADRIALLAHENRRVVAHALARLLVDGRDAIATAAPHLRTILAAPGDPTVIVRSRHWGCRMACDLTDPLRTLAAIALVDQNLPFDPPAGLDHTLRTTLGVRLVELNEHVAAARANGTLPTLLDRLEDQCRTALGIPPHLAWPRLAAAPK